MKWIILIKKTILKNENQKKYHQKNNFYYVKEF